MLCKITVYKTFTKLQEKKCAGASFLIKLHAKNILKIKKKINSCVRVSLLKVHECRFENLSICSCSYKNNTLKISHS